jgi:membrane protease YdiL (CAAX protease family)
MRLSPRAQAAAFVLITFALSWSEQYYTIHAGIGQNSLYGLALMWTPGLVAIALSLLFGQKLKDLAFRRPDWKSLALAYAIPATASLVVFGLVIAFGFGEFELNPAALAKKDGIGGFLFTALVFAPTVGMLIAGLSGLGEELGWRGFLHSKLLDLKPNLRYLITGLIWSIWHFPLILFSDYSSSAHPALSLLLFTAVTTSYAFVMGYLRDRSQSVIPAALAHGAHNMWFLGITPLFFKPGPLAQYFAGESGAFCALLYVLAAVAVARKRLE